MVDGATDGPSLGWCSRCHRISAITSSDPFFGDYHLCPSCPGVYLVLPDCFGEYARSALVMLASHRPDSPVPLVELARVLGHARAHRAGRPASSRVAEVVAADPGLGDLLASAQERDELEDALLTLWVLVGELLMATHDPSVVEATDPRDRDEQLELLHRIIAGERESLRARCGG